MTVFKAIFQTAKTVARHLVTREIAEAVGIIIIREVFKRRRRCGR